MTPKTVQILLVEDNPGDVDLVREMMERCRVLNQLHVTGDGEEALAFLRREGKFAKAPRPELILLDLNLPKLDGREFLAIIKNEDRFKRIPVVILTSSEAETDIVKTYDLHANCYITKPVDLVQFGKVVQSIEGFWLSIVKLPPQ